MKHSPRDNDLYKNFKPSKFSGEGFLGTDERLPDEIIAGDLRLLDEFGVTPGTVADALETAYDRAVEGAGRAVEIQPGVTAVFHESRGRIPSPFRGEGTFEKGEVVLTHNASEKKIIITRLSIHLIREHGFFQGRGARFRIDPAAAVEVLKLS